MFETFATEFQMQGPGTHIRTHHAAMLLGMMVRPRSHLQAGWCDSTVRHAAPCEFHHVSKVLGGNFESFLKNNMKLQKLPFAPWFGTQSPTEKHNWPKTETVSPTLSNKDLGPPCNWETIVFLLLDDHFLLLHCISCSTKWNNEWNDSYFI